MTTQISDAEALARFESGEFYDTAIYFPHSVTDDIRAGVLMRRAAENHIANAVHTARDAGVPWAAISTALGLDLADARQQYA